MIDIFCVLRSGGDYDVDYMERLAAMVKRNLTLPYTFNCMSDIDFDIEGIVRIPLKHNWPGWWSKMELFSFAPKNRIVFFDLDTIIIKNIDALCQIHMPDGFAMIHDVGRPASLASGIMSWDADLRFLYNCTKNITNFIRPDGRLYMEQEFIEKWCNPMLIPTTIQFQFKGIVSYKYNCTPQNLPDEATIVCFHGKPRPREAMETSSWLKNYWIK